MLKITDDNYEYHKKVLNALYEYVNSIMQVKRNNQYSLDDLLDSWERKSKSLAKRGLKEGLRDMLMVLLELSPEMKAELSNQLISQGLPGFNHLVSTIKNTPQSVSKRGKIRNLDEYHIVKEFLDNSFSDITLTDRRRLQEISVNFETNYGKQKDLK